MADPKGTDKKPTGPVKPPVLDLKPRPAGATAEAKPGPEKSAPPPPKSDPVKPDPAKAEASKPESTMPEPPRPAPAAAEAPRPGFAFGAALAGGILGLAAAYGLAWFGYWPSAPVAPPPADPRLAQFASAIPELETVTRTTQSELATLTQRLGALESTPPDAPAAAPVDLSGVETDIAALAARIDRLAATPSAATTDSAEVDGLREDVAALTTRLDEIAARLGTTEAGLTRLDTSVSATAATLADQPGQIGAVLQLPLILSSLESAFATGRPYAAELAALRGAMPGTNVPASLVNAADTGLARPDMIATRFAEVLPAMLAGRPAAPDAQWQDGALDWLASAIALRPTGEIEGDTPEAVMSRLEGAIARRDFLAADTLLTALPPPMRAAADDVPALVAAQAEAARFLTALRTSALSGEATP